MSEMQKKIEYPDHVLSKVELVHISNYPLHSHTQDLQVLYILKGEICLRLTNVDYYLNAGDVHIVHPDDVHSIQSMTENNLILVVSVHTPYYEKFIPNLRNLIFTANVRDESTGQAALHNLTDSIISLAVEQYHRDLGGPDSMQEKTLRLLTLLTTKFRGFSINPTHDLEHKTTYDLMQINRISNVICYIYENYASKLSLSEIAEHENISLHYLSHLFQRYVGISFRDFIGYARVEMSQHELLTTDHSISRISQNSGFSNAQYYTRNFHYWFGMHPKDFRRKYSQQTLAFVKPIFELHELKELEHILPNHIFSKHFDDRTEQYQVIHLNLNEDRKHPRDFIPPLLIHTPPISLWKPSKYAENITEEAIANIYRDSAEQRDAISLLKTIACDDVASLGEFNYIDTRKNAHGLMTVNGLKKPIAHLLEMLMETHAYICSHSSNYIIMNNTSSWFVLLFNEHASSTLQADILIHQTDQPMQITCHLLQSENTFMKYWSQLQFSWSLRQSDREIIDRMTLPEVSYQILSGGDPEQFSCTLDPLDIAMIEISASPQED